MNGGVHTLSHRQSQVSWLPGQVDSVETTEIAESEEILLLIFVNGKFGILE